MSPDEREQDRRAVMTMLADLESVGGKDLVHRLLSNFAARLTEVLDPSLGGRTWSRAEAHALAGIAGMLGFKRLSAISRSGMDTGHVRPPKELTDALMDALAFTSALLSRCREA